MPRHQIIPKPTLAFRKDSPINSNARNSVADYGAADLALQRRMARELAERNRPTCDTCGGYLEKELRSGERCPHCFAVVVACNNLATPPTR